MLLFWSKMLKYIKFKYSCSSAISTLEGIENKRRLQTLSIDNAWSNKNFLYYLTFRMLQHTSSEVNGCNCYKHLKNPKIKRVTGNKIKNNKRVSNSTGKCITSPYSFFLVTVNRATKSIYCTFA